MHFSCVPEANLLSVNYVAAFRDNVNAIKKNSSASRAMEQHGFLSFEGSKKACTLSGIVYELEVSPLPSSDALCGGVPKANISLRMNRKTLIDNVPVGDVCQMPALQNLLVTEVPGSSGRRQIRFCYKSEIDAPERCVGVIDKDGGFSKIFPLSVPALRELDKRQNP